MKDDEDYQAVFKEQGTSASQMTAVTFLDTIGRLPGMSGNVDDVVSANTHVLMSDAYPAFSIFSTKNVLRYGCVFRLEEVQDPATASKTSLCHCIVIYTAIRSQMFFGSEKYKKSSKNKDRKTFRFDNCLYMSQGKQLFLFRQC